MADTNIPKISCVNRVQFLSITAHASVSAMIVMHAEAHIPVHASAVAKGSSHSSHTRLSSMRNTVVGPVVRSTISG